MQRPRCREIRERNRAGHTFLFQAWETCARNPSTPIRHPGESRDLRRQRDHPPFTPTRHSRAGGNP